MSRQGELWKIRNNIIIAVEVVTSAIVTAVSNCHLRSSTALHPKLIMSVILRGQSDDSRKEEDLVKTPALWTVNTNIQITKVACCHLGKSCRESYKMGQTMAVIASASPHSI